jgi:hypothetical protein
MNAKDLLIWSIGATVAVGLSAVKVDTYQAKNCDTVATRHRDKTGTSTCPETTNGSPTRGFSMSASRQNVAAEGMGFEPTTP